MYIKNLRMANFRNYAKFSSHFSSGCNIIYGNNAQGKTNIIEAIFMCASGRSHRTNKDNELVRFGEKAFSVQLTICKNGYETKIDIGYDINTRKKIRINDIPVQRIGNLMGVLNAVIFSPEDMMIIREGPAERRKFVDITLSQLKPSYFYDLQQYSKILSQKNSLLKGLKEKNGSSDTIGIWNEKLAETGARITRSRYIFIEQLKKIALKKNMELTNNREELVIKYVPSLKVNKPDDLDEIKKVFEKTAEENLSREIAAGTSVFGPQRDDYEITLDGSLLKSFGSQGQQRTAVLALKLSEIEILKKETGENPVLLLDDVMSELDRKRQEFLAESLKNIQTFITCTDKLLLSGNIYGEARYYLVDNGKLIDAEK